MNRPALRVVAQLRFAFLIAALAWVGSSTAVAADAIQVTGQVVDASTGRPIPRVRVCAASVRENSLQRGEVAWQQHLVKTFDSGKIDFRMEKGYAQTMVRIDAAGYRPFISPVIQKNEPLSQDFVLSRETIRGTVVTHDDQPAVNAQVAISTWTLELTVRDAKISPGYNWKKFNREIVHTDANGRFELPAETDPFTVVATHDSGYGQLPIRPSSNDSNPKQDNAPDLLVRLEPWGSVAGNLVTPEGSPVVGRKLWISGGGPGRSDPGHVRHMVTRVAGAEGQFEVNRLAPGSGVIQHAFDNAAGNGSFSPSGLSSRFKLEPGESLNVKVGKSEAGIIGRLVLPDELAASDLTTARFRVQLYDNSWKFRSSSTQPVIYPGWTRFSLSKEGAAYRLDGTPNDKPDRIRIGKDGRFELVGLPSARYSLQIQLGSGFAAKRFVVSLNATEKVDIGEVSLRVK